MITDIQKLPSGFYAVWNVNGGERTLFDASSGTFHDACEKALGLHKGFSVRRSWRTVGGERMIQVTEREAEHIRSTSGQCVCVDNKYFTPIGYNSGCFYCPEKYMCDRVAYDCPKIGCEE